MADYPGSLWDGWTLTDLVDYWTAARANSIADEVVAIQTELGTDPAGSESDVADRLDAIESGGLTESDAIIWSLAVESISA